MASCRPLAQAPPQGTNVPSSALLLPSRVSATRLQAPPHGADLLGMGHALTLLRLNRMAWQLSRWQAEFCLICKTWQVS